MFLLVSRFQKKQLMLAAAMRQDTSFRHEMIEDDPQINPALPHRVLLSPYRNSH
jgi:hypothetical protein